MHRTLNHIPARPVVFARSQWRDRQNIRIAVYAVIATPCLWGVLVVCFAAVGKQ